MKKIFISHTSDDNIVSKKIAQHLRNDGAEIWIHYADLEVNGDLPEGIEQAIECCDAFVLILSKRTIHSRCVDLEYQTALKLNKKIIPCLFADTKQKFRIYNFECINFCNFEEGYEDLLVTLNFKEREDDVNTESVNPILNLKEKEDDVNIEPTNPILNFKEREDDVDTEPANPILNFNESMVDINTEPTNSILDFKEREEDVNTETTNPILNFNESVVDINTEPANHAFNFEEREGEIITEATIQDQFTKPILIAPIFRYQPQKLSENDVNEMLKINNLFEKNRNKQGTGFNNQLELDKVGEDEIIVDYNSGLIWLPDGSSEAIVFNKAKAWIEELNRINYAHYDDWRLPTLEEVMSLMTKEQKNGELFIDPIFDPIQRSIWTSDLTQNESLAWVVFFNYGSCYVNCLDLRNYVRAVRSEQLEKKDDGTVFSENST